MSAVTNVTKNANKRVLMEWLRVLLLREHV